MLENFSVILGVLATISGVLMSLANFPQTIKIIMRKSCADVSILTYLILLPGNLIWTMYGISISNMPVLITNFIGSLSTATVIVVYYIYKK